ncbi:uncharacterized protein Bfra_007268 [Botrytis fragariae]|uniref:Uncharacterized protein n=1 Tax=Botrytis fragariae TaxID=1964551 RepID=A0A8H6AHW1_9HELO|nr:uncharacterized protein Bfra_007268 [Botrytis fragariae]KAF5868073.1 hypothetical protein Bfra_007268 [Botrytis fragariae]
MSFHGRNSSSHKEPQADGSQAKDTNLDQASSGPSVMMGEESKDKNPTEGKPAKKKRERKHRQGFYNRDRRIYGVQRAFGFWEAPGREGAEQDATSNSEWDSDAPYPPPQIKNCNLRDYNIPVNDKTPMENLGLEKFILTATKDILTSSCISWLRKYHPNLVAKEGWGDRGKSSLELYHEMFESSAEIKDNTLQLVEGETAETFLTLLKKVRQIRHCVFRRGRCIDMPIIIVELMLQGAIRLTRMVGGTESLSMLEKFRSRLAREMALNEDVKVASDRLKPMFKKEELDMDNEIQVRVIRAERVKLDDAIAQKKRRLEVIDNQFADEVESGL